MDVNIFFLPSSFLFHSVPFGSSIGVRLQTFGQVFTRTEIFFILGHIPVIKWKIWKNNFIHFSNISCPENYLFDYTFKLPSKEKFFKNTKVFGPPTLTVQI